MIDTDKHEGSKGQYFTGKMVDNYLNMQVEIKRLREKNKKLHSRCMHLENLLEEWQGAYE
tara:strand:+ start:19917 stop:20096 length:180 start_codon:yes stop_codon:yes gene_type:complete